MTSALLTLALACSGGPYPPIGFEDTAPPVDSDPPGTTDTETPTGIELGPCEAPDDLADDPLTLTGQVNPHEDPAGGVRTHLLDLDRDPVSKRIYAAGYGGLFVFEDGPNLLGHERGSMQSDLYNVIAWPDDRAVVSNRTTGVELWSAADPATPVAIDTLSLEDASGLGRSGELLYVLMHTGSLRVYDLSEGDLDTLVHEVTGLGNPWRIEVLGDVAYVADNTKGVGVLDLADPAQPVLVGFTEAAGPVQDLSVMDGHLYAAVGGAGVQSFSLDDPKAPAALDTVSFPTSVVSVSADAGRVWAADLDFIRVVDATDPGALQPLTAADTEEWAMHVLAEGDVALSASWGYFDAWSFDGTTAVPELDTTPDKLFFWSGEPQTLSVVNTGSAPLSLTGLEAGDARITATASTDTVAPGDSAEITVAFADDGAPLETTLCLASNDPDEAQRELVLSNTSSGSNIAVGEPAIDFTLTDIDGVEHTLSDQAGAPVVLVYFATW